MLLLSPLLGFAKDPVLQFTPGFIFFNVEKDKQKFEEQNMTKVSNWGVESFQFFPNVLGGKFDTELQGKALIPNKDYDLFFNIFHKEDKDLFYIKNKFQSFTKYYDNSGGYYKTYTTEPNSFTLDKDLKLFVSDLSTKMGGKLSETWSSEFEYAYKHKSGDFANYNWANAQQGATQRRIVPVYTEQKGYDLHEFNLAFQKAYETGKLKLEQGFVRFRDKTLYQEKNQDTAAKLQQQDEVFKEKSFTSTILGEKDFISDKLLGGFSLRYENTYGKETENLDTFDSNGAGTSGKNFIDAQAKHTLHQLVFSPFMLYTLGTNWFLNGRVRTAYKKRISKATYPEDTDTPNGTVDETFNMKNIDFGWQIGEQFNLNYKGWNRFTPYARAEFEQNAITLKEDQTNQEDSTNNFFRETDQTILKYLMSVGFYSYPFQWLKVSAQYNFKHDLDKYKDSRETAASSSSDKSAFVDDLTQLTNRFHTNLAVRPLSWFHLNFRYEWFSKKYSMQKEGLDPESSYFNGIKHAYIATLMPMNQLTLVETLAFNKIQTQTPAGGNATLPIPYFNSDYKAVLSSLNYDVSSSFSFKATHSINWSDNYINFESQALPNAIDQKQQSLEVKIAWKPSETLTITPGYGFGKYDIDSRNNIDDYDYHYGNLWVNWIL